MKPFFIDRELEKHDLDKILENIAMRQIAATCFHVYTAEKFLMNHINNS